MVGSSKPASNDITLNRHLPDTPTLSDAVEREESYDVVYEFTATTFRKTSRLPHVVKKLDGSDFTWYRTWNHERITNEVNALRLVSQKTAIPVPRLIDYGVNQDGTRYLVTERIPGLSLNDLLRTGCPLPEGQRHTVEQPCKTCLQKAHSNAIEFIKRIVLPELANLKSQERGLLGFVMPPSWLADSTPPWTGRGPWKTHRLEEARYVFQHGDLGGHNVLLHPETLHVSALIDWEHAGFFPPGMERWNGTLDKDAYIRRRNNVADAVAEFLAEEYLECFHRWQDKAELALWIERGEIPRLEQLGLNREK